LKRSRVLLGPFALFAGYLVACGASSPQPSSWSSDGGDTVESADGAVRADSSGGSSGGAGGSSPAAGGGAGRESPTETSLWELKDVTMTLIKLETDSDYHIVVSDGTHTMIVEVPYPDCATGSPWSCFVSRARAEVDVKLGTISSSPSYPGLTVTVRGVGFFDYAHGQTGVAPNAIELHPLLQICFGQGCTPT
jgi:hypothetical protein